MAIELLPLPDAPETPRSPDQPIADCERPLTMEEIEGLAPIFASNGGVLPDPTISTVVGAFRGGKLVAFLTIQLKVHAQPLYIEHGHSVVLPSLVKAVENHILTRCGPTWVYLFASPGRLTELATAFGMEVEPWHVLSKLVMPKAPIKDLVELQGAQQILMEYEGDGGAYGRGEAYGLTGPTEEDTTYEQLRTQ